MKKKTLVVIILALCLSVIIVSFASCAIFRATSEYKEVRDQTVTALNRGNAAVIVSATNTHNVLCDDDKKILAFPETIDEYTEMNTSIPVTMENEDYQNALPFIAYDEDEDEFYLIDDSDD